MDPEREFLLRSLLIDGGQHLVIETKERKRERSRERSNKYERGNI